MNVPFLVGGVVSIFIGLAAIWIAMPAGGAISRDWLRSQAGVLYPLVPVVFIVFGLFAVLSAFGLA